MTNTPQARAKSATTREQRAAVVRRNRTEIIYALRRGEAHARIAQRFEVPIKHITDLAHAERIERNV